MYRADCLKISLQLVLAIGLLPSIAAADPTVLSGLTKSFSKAGFADSTDPAYWDQITPNVALTRGNQGMINAVYESGFDLSKSPEFTEWATDLTSPGETIEAENWSNLTYTNWLDAFGGSNSSGTGIVDRPAVLYLPLDDIYLDIKFTQWETARQGGSFAYLRAEPVPEPTAGLLAVAALAGLGIGRPRRFPRKSTNP